MIRLLKYAAIATATILSVVGATTAHSIGETVKPVFTHPLPNVPGKRLVAVLVTYAPGGKSPAHSHAKSAFVYAQVLSGSIRSKVNGEQERVYKAGDNFFEDPGSHHAVSENASETESASLLAVFVVDTSDRDLTTPDE